MSPRRKLDMRIALPPRMAMNFHGAISPLSTCSSTPHTPMPYDFVTTPDIMTQQYREMHFDELESVSSAGSKRGREEAEEDASWTETDLTAMQNVLAHPFRPVSCPYPPGELPPPDTLDELTHQLLKYAYRPSPKKHSRAKTSPSRDNEDGWTHTWEATRRKLFRFALAESQIAHGAPEDRNAPRNERLNRPGLKRMDSMDFMDEDEEDATESDKIGRALRLSTSLQNSSKQCPLASLTRSNSDDTISTMSRSSSSTSLASSSASLPSIPSAITITPSSPVAPSPRRRGSRMSQPRPSRPSLLQRGRSFTASDLEADSGILASPTAASRTDTPIESARLTAEPRDLIPSEALPARKERKLLTIPAYISNGPRLTRSQSTEQNLNAHAAQKSFIATRQPTTTERAALALPFESTTKKPAQQPNYGWSDSEDETASTAVRHIKKTRPARPSRAKLNMPFQPLLQSEMLGGSGLRSPFEEKSGMGF